MHRTVSLFDIPFTSSTLSDAADALVKEIEHTQTPKVVITPNVNHLIHISNNDVLKYTVRQADYLFADGFPIVTFSRLIKHPLPERVTGADLMPLILTLMNQKKDKSVCIVGGFPGEESLIIQSLQKQYPSIRFSVISPSKFFDPQGDEAQTIVEKINRIQPDVVFVCLGMPKQEIWATYAKPQIKTKLLLCFGAALDFMTGKAKRAPRIFQVLNLEWFWRLVSHPKRLWKRYLIENITFIKMAIEEYRRLKRGL